MEAKLPLPTPLLQPPQRCHDRDQCSDWCRARASSPPHFRVDSVLIRYSAVESRIVLPGACDVAEIALTEALATDARSASQGFDGNVIQALPLFPRAPTEGSIKRTR